MLGAVIGVIVVVVLVVGGILLMRRSYAQKIKALSSQASDLGSDQIEKQIHALKGLHLTGESLKAFTRYQREYQQLAEGDGARIETSIMNLETDCAQMHFGTLKAKLPETAALVDNVKKQYGLISTALDGIYQSEEKNRKQLKQLRHTYEETRKTLLAKNFAFGESMPALEDRLADIAAGFKDVDDVAAKGDHQAATEKLQTLTGAVNDLADICAKIPVLLTELVKEFPDQLGELRSGYTQLKQHHYQFAGIDLPETFKQISVSIANSKTALFGLNLEAAAKQNKDIAATIDHAYDVMEAEMKANAAVQGRDDRITKFIAHAQRQNRLLIAELDHLKQSYHLTHDEMATAEDFRQELSTLRSQHDLDLQALADGKAVFSQIQENYDHAETRLRDIETKQAEINTAVSCLKEGEKAANNALEGFARDLRVVARELEGMSLPGLPQDFREQFAHVEREIKDIDADLAQVKINLDTIGEAMIGLQSDMDNLKQAATEIIDAVGMTAQLLQAANRYDADHPELSDARTKAKALYNQMRYKEAADTIAAALETAVPGSYQKVEDAYLSDKAMSPL